MRLLLDTNVVLWNYADSGRLNANTDRLLNAANEIRVSAVSFAEIGIKVSVGKLTVPPNLIECVERDGIQILPLTAPHGLSVADLPLLHRDPFDRLLVAQARVERLTLLTGDRRLAAYDVPTVIATD